MQRSAVSAGHQHEVTQTPVAHDAAAEAGDDLSTLLGAGQFLEAVIDHIPAVVFVKDARDFRFILLNRSGEQGLSPQDHERLAQVRVELDRYWDLLRQRRAREEFGDDPDDASLRDAGTVENYEG